MRPVRTQNKPETMPASLEVEVSLPGELINLFHILIEPNICNQEIPAEWVTKVRRQLLPETRATIDQIGFFFHYQPLLVIKTICSMELFFNELNAIPEETFVDTMLTYMQKVFAGLGPGAHTDDEMLCNIILKVRDGQTLSDIEQQFLLDEFESKEVVERAIRNGPLLKDQATIKRRYIDALQDFYKSYFVREAPRIEMILNASAERTRSLIEAQLLPKHKLIESITNGFTLAENAQYNRVILSPSFYTAPFVMCMPLLDNGVLIFYPARPDGMDLDGSQIDNGILMRRLKALADKTRLEILQLLARRPYNNNELAEVLHLTQPTISHHMRDLRVAGLVRVEEADHTKLYYLRNEFIEQLSTDLYKTFGLANDKIEAPIR